MKYLIKSLKWSKYNKIETWYKSNENGYTSLIADAGIYSEADKCRIEPIVSEKTITFIPLTQKIINKGKRQLKKKTREINDSIIKIKEQYFRNIESTKKDTENVKENEFKLLKLQLILAEGEGENETGD